MFAQAQQALCRSVKAYLYDRDQNTSGQLLRNGSGSIINNIYNSIINNEKLYSSRNPSIRDYLRLFLHPTNELAHMLNDVTYTQRTVYRVNSITIAVHIGCLCTA